MSYKRHLSRSKTIMLGFIIIILIGTLLLMTPGATKPGQKTTFLGALFTSVSATCVTGLVVYDTWSHWTVFGQVILLSLIQIGGLGFITIGTFVMIILRKKIGLSRRALIQDSLSTLQIRGSVLLVRRIICGTLIFEGTGALLLACRFVPRMGFAQGIYYGIFHSISAFCNAGFDIMGFKGEYSSFCSYYNDPLVIFVLSFLIVMGGMGFVVWEDLLISRWHWRKYRFQTKVVLTVTGVLIFAGTALFLMFEHNNLFAGMKAEDQVWAALFSAVTPRTAGFNTIDTAALTNGSLLLTICLMFIGGSPGSTAGGIKTTTLFVILLNIKSYLFREKDCVAFKARMEEGAIKKAGVVVFINFLLAMTGSLVILAGQDLPLPDVLFEVFSAIGTVGMSTGVTRDLNNLSQIVIMLLMFCGRMGSLTFAMSFTERRRSGKIRYPQEQIIIG